MSDQIGGIGTTVGSGSGSSQQNVANAPNSYPSQTQPPSGVGAVTPAPVGQIADYELAWMLSEDQVVYYTTQFCRLQPDLYSFVDAIAAKNFFSQSNLDTSSLSQIWDLSDVNKDGVLSLDEFCIAMHLSVACRHGLPLPAHNQLPNALLQVAGKVNKIVSIFTKYNDLNGKNTALTNRKTEDFQRGTRPPPAAGATAAFSQKSFGFDDDFGGSHLVSQSGDDTCSSANTTSTTDFNNQPSLPHYQKSDLFQSSNNHYPVIPPRSSDTFHNSPSNPPPSRPPPSLKVSTGASSTAIHHNIGISSSSNVSSPNNSLRSNPVPGQQQNVSVEFVKSASVSKSNAQLIQELKDLVLYRNQLDSQIEALQTKLRDAMGTHVVSSPAVHNSENSSASRLQISAKPTTDTLAYKTSPPPSHVTTEALSNNGFTANGS